MSKLSTEMRRKIASIGGKAAHAAGTAHKFNSEEARKAGKLGGESVSQNREHMKEIGRKGGAARAAKFLAAKAQQSSV